MVVSYSRDYRRAAAVGESVDYRRAAAPGELMVVFELGAYHTTAAVHDSIVLVVLWAHMAARKTTVVDDSKVVGRWNPAGVSSHLG